MGKKKVKSTTTPTIETPLQQPLQDFTSNTVGKIAAADPTQFVAPASPLQQQAWALAQQQLGGGQSNPYWQNAFSMAQEAGGGGPSQATAGGYQPGQLGPAPTFGGAQLGAAPTGQAAQIGAAPTYGGAQLGPASQMQAAQLDPAAMAQFRGMLEGGGVNQYMNPALDSYLKSTLGSYDQDAAEARAGMRAQAAGNRAFGGSRYGVQEGTYDARTGLGRAQLEGQMRTQAFQDATQTALSEAGRRQQLEQTNQAAQNQFALQRGAYGQEANRYNADIQNQFGLTQAQLAQQAGLASQALQGQYGLSQADREQAMNMANLNMQGQYGLQQGQFGQQAGLANQALQGQYGLAGFDAANQAGQWNAGQQNQTNQFNAQMQEQARQRQLQAAGLYGDLTQQYGGQQRADLAMLSDMGTQQRGVASEYANALPTQAQLLGGLYGGLYPAYIGQKGTQTQSGGLIGDLLKAGIGGAAQGIASGGISFSDRRLKTDARPVGKLGPLNVYRYRLLNNDEFGVMADEVERHAPEALGPVIGGYATVDYGKLMEA